jgi:hypothetical protein
MPVATQEISDYITGLPTATLTGTEEIYLATDEKTTVNEISTFNNGNIISSFVNDSKSSVGGGFVDFTTGTITIPNIDAGESFTIEATFRKSVPPASGGFGIYLYFNNQSYVHPVTGSPTYANSFLKLPFSKERIKVNITVSKIDASNVYILCESFSITTLGVTGDRVYFAYDDAINIDSVTNLIVQSYISAGGTLVLEYLNVKINKI